MKLRNLTTALLALAGTVLISQTAQASFSYATGDLILGFYEPGSSTDLFVDLGNASTFVNGTAIVNLAIPGHQVATDLNSIDANWATDNSLEWSIVGGTNSSGSTGVSNVSTFSTVFLSSTVALKGQSVGTQNSVTGAVNTVGGADSTSATLSTNTVNAYVQTGAPGGNTYASQTDAGSTGGPDFATGKSLSNTVGTGSTLSLYQLNPVSGSTGTLLGTFGINTTTGAVSYVSAVPEPSTYALMLLGVGLLFWQVKSRNQVNS